MEYTSLQIAEIINGKILGSQDTIVNGVAKIEEGKEGDLCFLSNTKYLPFLYTSEASIVIINNKLKLDKKIKKTLIQVEDPYLAFSKLLKIYSNSYKKDPGINTNTEISKVNVSLSETCYIGPFVSIEDNVVIEDNVHIYPHCYIGKNVIIKKNTIIFPGCKIYQDCIIGESNIIHAGAVIGADGFGFAYKKEGDYDKISQIGNVITCESVEIGANTTIDRATMGSTIINKGVKLDNQIQIGHNVEIGENTVIAGLTGIAGSTKIGKNCMIGGSTGFAGHLKIGNYVKVAGHTGVGSNIKDNETIQGPYAFNQKDFLRSYIIFKKLPEMYKTVASIQKSIKNR